MANGLFNLKQVVQAVQQGGWPAQKTPAVEYLVVAGGGGGGAYSGSGAGGLLQGVLPTSNGQSLLITVGGGGAANSVGSNSVFSSITTTGGGTRNSPDGGSGSGGWNGPTNTSIGPAGRGIFGQGNAGGYGRDTGASYYGGGGGGAGNVGYPANSGACGTGGSGIASAISGTVTAYAGGGGGGQAYGANPGAGGVGGGGAGGDATYPSAPNGYAGTPNTGGGGGASSYNGTGGTPGAGGSGIVIISYPDTYAAATTVNATASTSGSGSVSFNGSTYADYPASTNNFATGDFTIEAWVYYNSFTSGYTLWFTMDPNTTYFGPTGATTTKLNLGTGGELSWTTSTISLSTWYHTAVVRSGTTITLYINGVSQGTNTSSNTLGVTAGAIRIGSASGYAFNGYLSNLRYTKSAVYTSNFIPSTAPLTSLANTRLLLNTVSPSPFNDSSGIGQTPTVTGTSSWNQLSPFTVTGYKNRVYTWTSSGSITF